MSHMPTAILESNLYAELVARIEGLEQTNATQDQIIGQLLAGSIITIPSAVAATYDVRAFGMVVNSSAAANTNRLILQTICDTIKTLGHGGRIYFPEGRWWIGTQAFGAEDLAASIILFGHKNITFCGDGVGSKILWTGNLLTTAKYLFWARGGGTLTPTPTLVTTENIVWENLYFAAVDQTNNSEHNHIIRLFTQFRGDVRDCVIRNCWFGWTNGDCVNLGGTNANAGNPTTQVENVKILDCHFDGFDTSEWTTTPPTGGYRSCVAHQQGVHEVLISRNWMSGSDDSLIDIEPTGTQGNFGIAIVDNWLVARSPTEVNTGTPTASYLTIAVSGNGETEDVDIGQRVIIARNHITNGRIKGLRMCRSLIAENVIETDTSATIPDAAIYLTESMQGVQVVNNFVKVSTGCAALVGIYVTGIDAIADARRERVLVAGNEVSVGNGVVTGGNPSAFLHGIAVESCDARIVNNRVELRGNATNVSNAIQWKPITVASRAVIADNEIVGDAGGGTWQYGISIAPDGAAIKAITITGNSGTGTQTGGVRCAAPTGAGAYTTLPVVVGNSLPGGLVLGTDVYAIIGGNRDGITHTVGGNVSPEGVITAIQGSTHVRRAGDGTVVYRKTTGILATGWVTP